MTIKHFPPKILITVMWKDILLLWFLILIILFDSHSLYIYIQKIKGSVTNTTMH